MTQTLSGKLANSQRKLVALSLAGENLESVNPLISQINNGPLDSFHDKASGGFRGYNSDWSSGYGNIWSSAFLKSGLGSDHLISSSGRFGNIPLLLTTNPHHTVPFCLFIYNHSLPNTLVLINSSSCASLIHHLSSYMAAAQIASLAIRTGNRILLEGGKEAKRSNAILHKFNDLLKASGARNIVLISSVAGLVHVSVGSVYSVTKGMVCLAPYFISDFIWKQLAVVSIQTRLRAMVPRDEFRKRRNKAATIVQVLWMNYVCKVFKKMIRNKGEFVQIS
ncbi:unnamed protein product [Lactuca saligna]|uniref:Uncharacterized protein n=1 Tax=Lactuca saligna TaxID=75948 RepID=A0AA35VQ53_LACSI|nr:unnamed protein product [Lactuca saligna]